MSKKLNYKEGNLFSIPLKPDGFAIGLVARAMPRGPIILAYFFSKKYSAIPELKDLVSLTPTDAIKVLMVGDLGLMNGEWKIIGELPNWNKSTWKFPNFVRREEFSGRIWLVTYSDDNPNLVLSEKKVTEEDVKNLERDSLFGYGAVEKVLSKLLN